MRHRCDCDKAYEEGLTDSEGLRDQLEEENAALERDNRKLERALHQAQEDAIRNGRRARELEAFVAAMKVSTVNDG